MKRLILVLACLFGSAAHSQETDVQTGPQIGDSYVRDVFSEWALRCVRTPEGQKDRCHIYQLLRRENGNPIAEFTLFVAPTGSEAVAGARIVTPLETLLQPGLAIAVDEADAKFYPFDYCDSVGCFARPGFTALDIFALERGLAASIVIRHRAQPNQVIRIPLSLVGFLSAYDALLSAP